MGLRNGVRAMDDDHDDDLDRDDDEGLSSGAISLQKLLSSNVITNENGVIYLDSSSAQSLLASFGMPTGGSSEEEDEEEDGTVQKHIEEMDDSESS